MGEELNKPLLTVESMLDFMRARGKAPAIISYEGHVLQYEQLAVHIERTRTWLNRMGIGSNKRVAIVMPNGPEMAVSFLSVMASATAAPLNFNYPETEYRFYLDDLNADALIVPADFETPAVKVAEELSVPVFRLISHETGNGLFSLESDIPAETATHSYTQPEDIGMILHTSGTTSRPKIVPLPLLNLLTSAHNVKNSLQLKDTDRCLNMMPLFHIHGIIAALLGSMAAGGSIICTKGFAAETLPCWINDLAPTWYTAVPTIHQSVFETVSRNKEAFNTKNIRLIRSSSASLPPSVMKQLSELFDAPVIEAFGMTEAAHQIACNPLPPAKAIPGSVGLPAGPEICILGPDGNMLPVGEIGEVCIRGRNVFSGYENNETANREAFTNGWFRTGDQGYIDENGYLYLTGRLKELINRGGQKISPREIDEVLLTHPQIKQAVAFGIPHKMLGETIGAAIVLHPGGRVSDTELRTYLAERLSRYKIPQQFVFVDEVPKGPTGKLQRIGLHEKLRTLMETDYVSPDNPIQHTISRAFEQVLDVEKVGQHANFFQLGGDSLSAANLLVIINEETGATLDVEDVFIAPTVAELSELLMEHLVSRDSSGGLMEMMDQVSQLSDEEIRKLLDSAESE